MNLKQFQILMQSVADGWNTKNPQKAVDCFTPNAVYMEPPDKQLIIGHEKLLEYFGGSDPKSMSLVWHNLMFNEETQTGAGEFTFQIVGSDKNHGVVIVEIENEKIRFWREYFKINNLEFKEFISTENKIFGFSL